MSTTRKPTSAELWAAIRAINARLDRRGRNRSHSRLTRRVRVFAHSHRRHFAAVSTLYHNATASDIGQDIRTAFRIIIDIVRM